MQNKWGVVFNIRPILHKTVFMEMFLWKFHDVQITLNKIITFVNMSSMHENIF